ncbi:MAG: prolipoprotein diacylglyceryl transferase [Prevotella sp.]
MLSYILWNPDVMAFHLGPLAFRWYSLLWLIGLAGAYFIVKRVFKDDKIPDEKFEPLFLYVFIGTLLGARLGHCVFYQPDYFLTSTKGFFEMLIPVKLFGDGVVSSLTSGQWRFIGYEGLASHGGTLGIILALLLYSRRMKLSLIYLFDTVCISVPFVSCCIRLGNLMNSEIIGQPTTVPWAFIFERVDMLPRHPGQLYEAIAYALLGLIVMYIYRKTKAQTLTGTGFYFGLILFYIFTFRFFIELTKENQEAFEAGMLLNMGQILSIPFIIVGAIFIMRALRKSRK